MHLVLGLLIAAVIVYALYRVLSEGTPAASQATSAARSDRGFAFLSGGMIFFRERGEEIKQLHSPYAQQAMDRRERARERNAWKQGTSFNVAAGGGRRDFGPADAPLQATGAVFEANGDLLYFLRDEQMGGLFRREAATGTEFRLLIKQNLHLTGLQRSSHTELLAASSVQSDGIANIATMQSDGSNYREVTSGDTIDSSPTWIPGAPRRMLFQSIGLARGERGFIIAQGNSTIQKLDLDSGSVAPILDDPAFDYLKPRVTSKGDLLYIRRPFEAPRYGTESLLLDTVLFPFRLLRAVFHYLNFFSLMYSRKPLSSADSPGVTADMKSVVLQGKRIDAERALRNARTIQGVPSLVPDSWQLVCRNQEGEERVLATNVASYDLSPDDSIVYSNGRGVFVLEADGLSRPAATDQLVLDVFAAPTGVASRRLAVTDA